MAKETPQEAAAREKAAIRDLLFILGSATAEQLALELSMDAAIVRRRLFNNGPGVAHKQFQRFAYDKDTKRWSLTESGWRESEEANRRKPS